MTGNSDGDLPSSYWLAVVFLIIAGLAVTVVSDIWHHWVTVMLVGISLIPTARKYSG